MAKQSTDTLTLELPGFSVAPGRPRGQVVPGKKRTSEWRRRQVKQTQSLQERFKHLGDVELCRYMAWNANMTPNDREAMWREFGRRNGWRLPDTLLKTNKEP